MRLNMDCVRDILLCVEENTSLTEVCVFTDPRPGYEDIFSEQEIPEYRASLVDKYGADPTFYHVRYCVDAGLIQKRESNTTTLLIFDLTPKGHEFVNNIREANVWNKVKSVMIKAGASSLGAFMQSASDVVAELIRLNLPIA
ncbi:MAG: DUF2513 domain-containing protein [Eubacteriales bacterium]|nr:DUF2513 domain-containing protein [Eubacteriales bacterium]